MSRSTADRGKRRMEHGAIRSPTATEETYLVRALDVVSAEGSH